MYTESCIQIQELMKNITGDTDVVSFRMPKDIATRIRKAAKEKGESLQVYFLNQIDNNSELAKIISEATEQAQTKRTKVAIAILDYVVALGEIKEKSDLGDEEFRNLIVDTMNTFVIEKKKEILAAKEKKPNPKKK